MKTLHQSVFVLALVGAVALGSAAPAQSLKATLETAYTNSNLLQQNRALLRGADEYVAQATASMRPTLGITGTASAFDAGLPGDSPSRRNLALASGLTLYDGGARRLTREAAEETVFSTRAALLQLEQQVLLNAASAHFGVLEAGSVLDLQSKNLELIGSELEAVRSRFEVGELTRTDVAVAEARLEAARSSVASSRGALARAREAYRSAVGAYPGTLGTAGVTPRPAASLEEARQIARQQNPLIQQAQHDVKVADLDTQKTRTSFRPTIEAAARLTVDSNGNDTSMITLTVNQTIFAGGQRKSLYRQAAAQQDAARSNLLQTVLLVEQDVADAWANLEVANASLAATQEQVRAAQLAFDGFREEARVGARTTLDVLDAEEDLLDAKTSNATASFDRQVAAYALLSAMGRLTASQLGLDVDLYDPRANYDAVKNAPIGSSRGTQLDRALRALGRQ